MLFIAETLDDIMNDVFKTLVELPFNIGTGHGKTSEIFGVLIKLNNPRARLSRTETKGKPFSALGELLWYLSKNNNLDFIEYYITKYKDNSDDGTTIYGGYGPRIFNMHGQYDQLDCVIKLLKKRPSSRRAVIQIFDAKDVQVKYKDVPCTCTIQFTVRDNKLLMYTSMRSNDAFIGLPHDIFCFTMLQEIVARTLGVDIGVYTHSVGSLHLYEANKAKAEEYLQEGFQTTKISMPEMPVGDPTDSIQLLMNAEAAIRCGNNFDVSKLGLHSYWVDLIRLLQIHANCKTNDVDAIKELKNKVDNMYEPYIANRLKKIEATIEETNKIE